MEKFFSRKLFAALTGVLTIVYAAVSGEMAWAEAGWPIATIVGVYITGQGFVDYAGVRKVADIVGQIEDVLTDVANSKEKG